MNTQPDNSPLEVEIDDDNDNTPNSSDMAPGLTDRVAATAKPAGHVEDARDPKHDAPAHSMTY